MEENFIKFKLTFNFSFFMYSLSYHKECDIKKQLFDLVELTRTRKP